ncbi:hypothetical protein [Maribacter sp. 2210JD10-5]|uniref:hypothetical protein n=1 Tax=Maribacter sp. 2210JD10-5 TaxID=3386272 RepID=UPI0039BD3FA1
MILTKSPYYITAPLVSGTTSVTLNLKVIDSVESSSLSNPDYTIVKNKPSASTTNLDFEVSNLIRDFFEPDPIFSPTTALLDSNDKNVLSVNYSLTYSGGGIDQSVTNVDVLDGYGYFLEGINPQLPADKILLSNDYYVVNKQGYFAIPIYNDGTLSTVTVDGTDYTLTESSTVKTKVKYLWLNCNEFSGTILIETAGRAISLEIQDECKYQPYDIVFRNKFGVFELMTFSKVSKESIKTSSENFKANFVSNGSFDTTKHSFQDFNKNGREQIKLTSDFLPESYNETIRQLLLSEYVYILQKDGTYIPVNVQTKTYQYKTRIVDKLISYEMTFDYSFDAINNI